MKKYLTIGLIASLLFPYFVFAYELTDKDKSIVTSATMKIEKIISNRGESIREKIIILLKRAANNSSSNPRLQRIMETTVQNLRSKDLDIGDFFGYNEGMAPTGTGIQTSNINIPVQVNSQQPLPLSSTGFIKGVDTASPSNTWTTSVPLTQSIKKCYIQNGEGQEFGGGCIIKNCASGYIQGSSTRCVKQCSTTTHLEENQCVDNIRSCSVSNGAGQQTWDGNVFGVCAVVSCNAGYAISSVACTLIVVDACATTSVTAGGYTYPTKSMPDGKCWTTANMNHTVNTGNRWDSAGEILYDWNGATSNDLCPALGAGWTLPTLTQWHGLKNAGASGWTGNKLFGLISVLPGLRDSNGGSYWQGEAGQWWSSTVCTTSDCNTETNAWMMKLGKYASNMNLFSQGTKSEAYSVVCVKN